MQVAKGAGPFLLLVAVTLAAHRRRPLRVLVLWSLAVTLLVVSLVSAAPRPTTSEPSQPASPSPQPTLQQLFTQNAPAVVLIQQFDAKGLRAHGSGFIVSSSGVVVTNNHVIKPKEGVVRLTVTLPARGDTFTDVRVIYAEERRDFAVLSIKAAGLPSVKVGDSDIVQVGDQVVAIGNPMTPGLALTFTVGYVEAIRLNPFANNEYRIIQHQAPITDGNSGGPLFNMRGQVVGINAASFEFTKNNNAQNLNMAIPINYVKPYFSDPAKMTWVEWAGITATTPAPARPTPAPRPAPTPPPRPTPPPSALTPSGPISHDLRPYRIDNTGQIV